MRRISNRPAFAGLLLLGLAACGQTPGRTDASDNVAAPNAAAPAAPVAEPIPARLVLEGAGLRFPGESPPRTLDFGTPEAEAVAALTKVMGRPPTESGANDECGGGGLEYAAWKDEITIWFEDGRFAGWDLKGGLKTAGGIGIGSSRADLALLRGIEIEQSTLGTEFRAGGLSGILDSQAANAKVEHLWGGATCVFR